MTDYTFVLTQHGQNPIYIAAKRDLHEALKLLVSCRVRQLDGEENNEKPCLLPGTKVPWTWDYTVAIVSILPCYTSSTLSHVLHF